MKSVMAIIFLLLMGIAVSASAQSNLAEQGKALVKSKGCMLCHREGGLGKPMETLAGKKTDTFLKEVITDPKKAFGPQVRMPEFKLTDQQLQAVVVYLRSIAKH